MALHDIKRAKSPDVHRERIPLFPRVCSLGDGTRWNHVQQIFPLTFNCRGGFMSRQAGVDVGHGHTCQQTNTIKMTVDLRNRLSFIRFWD